MVRYCTACIIGTQRGTASLLHHTLQAPDHSDAPPPGVAEAVLLQQLLRNCGSSIDPYKQLCVTCEVCRRPATKECWTCRMAICDFCTRRQHWKVGGLFVNDLPLLLGRCYCNAGVVLAAWPFWTSLFADSTGRWVGPLSGTVCGCLAGVDSLGGHMGVKVC